MTSRAAFPRSLLVDAGAWLALADTGDAHHAAAIAIQRELVRHRPQLYVTDYLVDETYTLIRYRLDHRLAVRFLDRVVASNVTCIRVTPDDTAAAEAILRQYADKRFSYTDATSFVVMERLHISAAFSFDRNIAEYGRIAVLRP